MIIYWRALKIAIPYFQFVYAIEIDNIGNNNLKHLELWLVN